MIFNKYIIYVLSFWLLTSCENDDCSDDGDAGPNFSIFLKLETISGDNFLDKDGFDISKISFSFKDLGGNSVSNISRVIVKDNTSVLEFFSRFRSEVGIEYDNQEITSYKLEVIDFEGDCNNQVRNYRVFSESDTSLCGCEVGEIITLRLSI